MVQIVEGQPAVDAVDETDVGMLSGQSTGIMSSVNQQELQLGLLKVEAFSFRASRLYDSLALAGSTVQTCWPL